MRAAISIDWDFFVPEKVEYDLGHQESLIFLNMLWALRMGLLDEIKTNGAEASFWLWLKERVDIEGAELHLAESHTFCYEACEDVDAIVSFDAHHDCWNGLAGRVHCHDWARKWLEEGVGRKLTWVRPGHELCSIDQAGRLQSRVNVVDFSKDLALDMNKADVVYICRSGCWTPPWLDQAFIDFVEEEWDASLATIHQDGDWHPMRRRWTDEQISQFMEQHHEKMNMVREMNEAQQAANSAGIAR